MASEIDPVTPIVRANIRLSSWAVHELHPSTSSTPEGMALSAERQKNDYELGTQALKSLVEAGPVWLRLGSGTTLETHDPIAAEDKLRHPVQAPDLATAQAMFYDKTVNLPPRSSLEIDTVAQFMAPGDEAPKTYFGNDAARRFIVVDDIARALLDGSRLDLA